MSIGCPCGIGPEVSVVAAAAERARAGAARRRRGGRPGRRAGAGHRRDANRARVASPAEAWALARGAVARLAAGGATSRRATGKPGAPTRASGAAQLAWIDAACDLAASGRADALVTGPGEQGGHRALEGAGRRASSSDTPSTCSGGSHAREVVMAFWSPELATSLATTHLPLARVPARGHRRPRWRGPRTGSRGCSRGRGERAAAHRGRVAQPARGRGRPARARGADAHRAGHRAARARGSRASGIEAALDGPVPAETRVPSGDRPRGKALGAASSRCTTTRRPSR